MQIHRSHSLPVRLLVLTCACLGVVHTAAYGTQRPDVSTRPNIVFILTDDQRADAYEASGNDLVHTPNLDRIAAQGTRFDRAFVTLAICSPSRAACLTGQYGSTNGVTSVGNVHIDPQAVTFAEALREAGYASGVAGKWHLKTTPQQCGFEFVSTCWSNGTWYDRKFEVDGKARIMPGFVDDVTADESIRFIRQAEQQHKPFVLWMCTQVPHMDHQFKWPAKPEHLARYAASEMPLPRTWNDDLSGKPEYLKTSRNRTQALKYGYDDPENIRRHARDYYASVEQMDAAVGRVLDELDRLELRENTWIIFMGDNGWMLGEHGMTSKVLPYEESMRVPMAIAGPRTTAKVSDDLVLNIDLTATIYELAGLPAPKSLHGRSLLPIVLGETPEDWRTSFLYEAPTPQLGSQPLWAVRDARWKYVETHSDNESDEVFAELYNLQSDAIEKTNLADDPEHQATLRELAEQLIEHQRNLGVSADILTRTPQARTTSRPETQIPDAPPQQARTDIHISGVYPHLTTYGVYSQNGGHYKGGHNECGIGAIVPWAGKLWMVNYAPHQPRGSEHKLFSVDPDLSKPMTVHAESVGGTPAGRMIHKESNQLLIAHYLIDSEGNVRVISPKEMPIRVTAIARHLTDPKNQVYYIDMEGSIWEANVHTLAVKRLFKKPVPGWHGKGGYTSQGRLVLSNNGELHVGDYSDVLVGGKAKTEEERGVLAQFDGERWTIVERRQFTEVTGPSGISGGSDGHDPIWAIGWDRRSVRLKLLEDGNWHTYLLPKASYCNDASHGWYTEWPRIREITGGRWMMDMHGMFFEFPNTFSSKHSAGIRPIGSHLRYVPDFCGWNGKLVLATDETSIQGNELAGQPQSNLWFGDYDDLKKWGPASGYGGPWIDDEVAADTPSDPYLIAGFDRRVIHLATGRTKPIISQALRATDQQVITSLPEELAKLTRVTVPRGDWHRPGSGYEFELSEPATVYLAVDQRGDPQLDARWKLTDFSLAWGKGFRDRVYRRELPIGTVSIPVNATEHTPGSFGMPHMAMVATKDSKGVAVTALGQATVNTPSDSRQSNKRHAEPVVFTLQIDRKGDGRWTELDAIEVPEDGRVARILPEDLDATWLRLKTSRDCVATAFLHQTTGQYTSPNNTLFAGLANVGDTDARGALLYAAKRNRNLRVITADDRYFEFTKAGFEFKADNPDPQLKSLLDIEPEFTVDDASVMLEYGGRTLRLPKGDAAFDKPFASGWPRASREVESERHLANIHGTFYEVPLITNGSPPAWNLMRPVASHSKQITDFCSWNGLLVLAGVRSGATDDGHVFADPEHNAALWFGGIDDVWALGKPVGHGGPWRDSDVQASVPSDPYLMTGYDRKTVKLHHQSKQPVTITLQVDIDGLGRWVDYKSFLVDPGKVVTHDFATGFSACWVRVVSDRDTQATATLTYE
jgi:arylsulfatase A-like enzyme